MQDAPQAAADLVGIEIPFNFDKRHAGLSHGRSFYRVAQERILLVVARPLVLDRSDKVAATVDHGEIQPLGIDRGTGCLRGPGHWRCRYRPDHLAKARLRHQAVARAEVLHRRFEDGNQASFLAVQQGLDFGALGSMRCNCGLYLTIGPNCGWRGRGEAAISGQATE